MMETLVQAGFDAGVADELKKADALFLSVAPNASRTIKDLQASGSSDGEIAEVSYSHADRSIRIVVWLREWDKRLEWAWAVIAPGQRQALIGEEFGARTLGEVGQVFEAVVTRPFELRHFALGRSRLCTSAEIKGRSGEVLFSKGCGVAALLARLGLLRMTREVLAPWTAVA